MRGWSWTGNIQKRKGIVIPANAGVILHWKKWQTLTMRLSPRMRGWSWATRINEYIDFVIPANAGVILMNERNIIKTQSYPRECGGDPCPASRKVQQGRLSPRMRGWSWNWVKRNTRYFVIPTGAGGSLLDKTIVASTPVIPADAGRFDWYDNIINWNGECITITVSFLVMEFVFNRIKLFLL